MNRAMANLHYDRPDAFTPSECAAIVALGEARVLAPATVWSGSGDHVDPSVRQAARCYPTRDEVGWVYDRLDTLFAEAAARFELSVDSVFEDIQIVRYGVGDHFQVWHSDAGADRYWERLISVSVELSAPGDHDGGVLEIAPALGMGRVPAQGGARLFLSRAIHRVTPVTRGVRWAVVAWTGQRPAS